MARFARLIAPGCWHHVTQRGNRRQTVFFDNADRAMYVDLLVRYCRRAAVQLAGYCLMSNHVHLIAVPETEAGLAKALGRTHGDYARWLNFKRAETGHVWQNRFYSCVLDELHQWDALRYVELNPVRAGLARDACEWPWSSARAHAAGDDPGGILDLRIWASRWTPAEWRDALGAAPGGADLPARLREATQTGRPMVAPSFMAELESKTGRRLSPQKRGPKAKSAVSGQMSLGFSRLSPKLPGFAPRNEAQRRSQRSSAGR